jgi:adenylate cyclase
MRFLPNLRFGTQPYSEQVARRLRLLNLATWSCAAFSVTFAVGQSMDPAPSMWKSALVNAVAAVAFAAVPITHCLGALAGPLTFITVALVDVSLLNLVLGRDSGMQMQFLALAAASVLFFDQARLSIPILVSVLGSLLIIVLQAIVPANTGLTTDATLFGYFATGVIGTCAILFATVVYAVRSAARAEAMAERERSIADALLKNILPASVAERLKAQPGVLIADDYPSASVLFADMAGFTERASDTPPEDLIRFLNMVYSRLDEMVDRHGLEKIKTTGDAYMVVSGVPQPQADHAVRLANLAIEMRDTLIGLVDPKGRAVPVRIGLASGAVVAGVIGTRRFFYDVWGDAVNMASRMESTGQAGKIQVESRMHALLEGQFAFISRGEIEVRGKGRVPTWYLVQRSAIQN